jgi:hypothetical protein
MIIGALPECVVILQVAQFDVAQMTGKDEVTNLSAVCRDADKKLDNCIIDR